APSRRPFSVPEGLHAGDRLGGGDLTPHDDRVGGAWNRRGVLDVLHHGGRYGLERSIGGPRRPSWGARSPGSAKTAVEVGMDELKGPARAIRIWRPSAAEERLVVHSIQGREVIDGVPIAVLHVIDAVLEGVIEVDRIAVVSQVLRPRPQNLVGIKSGMG